MSHDPANAEYMDRADLLLRQARDTISDLCSQAGQVGGPHPSTLHTAHGLVGRITAHLSGLPVPSPTTTKERST